MWLNETLNIKYPLIQGGMANIATGAFAACVSNAGGLGLIAGGGMTPEMLRENIREAKSLTDHPFGDYHEEAKIGIVGRIPEPNGNGRIVVATGGTSDIPVAEEAALTAEVHGSSVLRLYA